jgi:hypothetical protein
MRMGTPDPSLPRSLRLARALDSKFLVPGTGFRFGIDPIIGLIPVVGDAISFAMGMVIVTDAWRLGARRRVLARMGLNLLVDWVIGSIPVIGDAADFFIKPNRANAALLTREHAAGRLRSQRP